ncbi:MAG: VOC family protein [Burkholderiales bacterium]
MATIRHIAIFADNPKELAKYYVEVFGMTITSEHEGDAWLTDGYINFALLPRGREKMPKGINHFGFTLDAEEKPKIYEKLKKLGLEPYDPRAADPSIVRPFVEDAALDPEGNRFDLSLGIRSMDEEKAKHD